MNPWDSQTARGYPDNGVWHCLNANENGGQSRDAVFCLQGNGIDRADTAGCNGKGWREDVSYTLNTIDRPAVMAFKQGQGSKAGGIGAQEECAPTLSAVASGTNQVPAVYDARGNGDGKTVCTITGDHQNRVTDYTALCVAETTRTLDANGGNPVCNQGGMVVVAFAQNQRDEVRDLENRAGALAANPGAKQQTYVLQGSMIGRADRNGPQGSGVNEDVSFTLNATDRHGVAYGIDRAAYNQGQGAKFNPCIEYEPEPTMVARGPGAVAHPVYSTSKNFVRRLTPLECERLQGYPDGWTDIGEWVDSNGKKHGEADSPRYKALGNSIALPFWQWMARRICAQYERPVTMASLFDGIGGFPLVFQRCGAVPVWASEIEEFPIAVTKVRLPDESV